MCHAYWEGANGNKMKAYRILNLEWRSLCLHRSKFYDFWVKLQKANKESKMGLLSWQKSHNLWSHTKAYFKKFSLIFIRLFLLICPVKRIMKWTKRPSSKWFDFCVNLYRRFRFTVEINIYICPYWAIHLKSFHHRNSSSPLISVHLYCVCIKCEHWALCRSHPLRPCDDWFTGR